ncbi:MAG: electron transport complex subunit RsxC [Gammaproteobacteria bacterium]|nr:electron transport complex subunit RsxC [Gammaproteobacteria bacterium]
MKLFRFRGGVHPEGHKQATGTRPIEVFPLPQRLYIPVQQHAGAPAEPTVKPGHHVLKGRLLAHGQGTISAPVHAPTSGTIVDIVDHTAPHPSGLPVRTLILEPDGKDEWMQTEPVINPFELDPDEIAVRVGASGVVGMGGAAFPSAVKLQQGKTKSIKTLIINGGECEPYLTCDDRLMQERAQEIIDGVRIMLHATRAPRALIAIEDNKPDAIFSMRQAANLFENLTVVPVPSLYPMGSDRQMIHTLTGLEVPSGRRSADIGVLMHNVGTAYAVHNAIRKSRPLVSRIVTVGGGAVREPRNLEVPIGTLMKDLFEYCGGFSETPQRILMGGPMMGQVMPNTDVPIIKGTSGIIALTRKEITQQQTMPCIRCGSCAQVCPCGLLPMELAARSNKGQFDNAVDYGLLDCISCGSCSYVCPSHIPLVQYFEYAKGVIASQRRDKQKATETRELALQRTQRMQREAEAKARAAEARKAQRQAQQQTPPPAKTPASEEISA